MTNNSKIFAAVVHSHPTLIFVEIHIKTPMKVIFNTPMGSYRFCETIYICQWRNKIAGFETFQIINYSFAFYHSNSSYTFPFLRINKIIDFSRKKILSFFNSAMWFFNLRICFRPVQYLFMCGCSSIILSLTRKKSVGILTYCKDFWRSQRQNLPKRRAKKDTEQALNKWIKFWILQCRFEIHLHIIMQRFLISFQTNHIITIFFTNFFYCFLLKNKS